MMVSMINQMKTDTVLLKAVDVARMLSISRSMAYQLMQRNEIPTVRIGRATRVRPQDLERFISENLQSG